VSISETDGKQKLVVNFDAAGCSTKDEDATAAAAASAAATAVPLSPRSLAEEQAKVKARKALGEFVRRAESDLDSARRLMESMEKVSKLHLLKLVLDLAYAMDCEHTQPIVTCGKAELSGIRDVSQPATSSWPQKAIADSQEKELRFARR
jgi:hypothetical protein